MRVSVPGIPRAILEAKPVFSINNVIVAIERLSEFLEIGNVVILTGAGVSVDSGIRAYRGSDGRYMNPSYKPIFYHDLVDPAEKGRAYRQRYWLRSYLGYPPVRDTRPNTTHFAIAALQYTSYVSRVITQNVDGLHHKAVEQSLLVAESDIRDSILELHGTLHRVQCNKGHVIDRNTFQEWLSAANPQWHHYLKSFEGPGTRLRTNPDGDVAVEHLGLSFNDFVVPDCPTCVLEGRRNSVHKPEVIFFGESIPETVKECSHRYIEECDRLLIVGTTLATYSAFRLLKYALELKKPVMLLNLGPTRADGVPGVEKIEIATGAILRPVAKILIGTRAAQDSRIIHMLESGIDQPPAADDDSNYYSRTARWVTQQYVPGVSKGDDIGGNRL